MKKIAIIITFLVIVSCADKEKTGSNYPLLSLYEAGKTLDGKRVKVTGYFGYWDRDIPVLYATFSDYKKADGLYKAHIMYDQQVDPISLGTENEGKVCTFEATIWYEYDSPTLDNAILVNCIE